MSGFSLAQNCKVVALSRRDADKARGSRGPFRDSARLSLLRKSFAAAPRLTRFWSRLRMHAICRMCLLRSQPANRFCAKNPWVWMRTNAARWSSGAPGWRFARRCPGVSFEESTARFRARVAAGDIGRPILPGQNSPIPAPAILANGSTIVRLPAAAQSPM